jgi:hypothetical protein
MTDRERVAELERVINKNLKIRNVEWTIEVRIDQRRYRAYETLVTLNGGKWETHNVSDYTNAAGMVQFLDGYLAGIQIYLDYLDNKE